VVYPVHGHRGDRRLPMGTRNRRACAPGL
jgi:hypothetical protein